MQSLSIWHWMIIAILIVLVVCAILLFARAINNRRPKDRSVKESGTATPVSGPSGFQGWLMLLAIGVFVSPIVTIVTLVQTGDLERATSGKYHLMYAADIGLYLLLFFLQICTAFLMALRERRFTTFYIATAIAMILFKPVDILLTCAIAGLIAPAPFEGVLQQYFNDIDPEDMIRWISTSVGLIIWLLYVIRSRRVANTFVR